MMTTTSDKQARISADIILLILLALIIGPPLAAIRMPISASAEALPLPTAHPPTILIITATPSLPTPRPTEAPIAVAVPIAPPTVMPVVQADPQTAVLITAVKTWVSPDSYTLPGSALVYYVDSNGNVVDTRLPGSEQWIPNAPAEAPTAEAPAPVAPPSNYRPRAGWHK
jgi:hypothetical protein